MTMIVFVACLAASFASIGVVLAEGRSWLILLVVSFLANIWAVARSERGGFVKSSEMRRAYEPPRHFNAAQVIGLIALVMLQVGIGAYVLIS